MELGQAESEAFMLAEKARRSKSLTSHSLQDASVPSVRCFLVKKSN